MEFQKKVREFQLASGQPVSDTKRQLTSEERDFRDNLLREEIRELQYAIVDNNRVEILDALCDIVYVALGTCNSMGIEYKFSQRDYYDPLYNDLERALESLYDYSDQNRDYCILSVIIVCHELANILGFTLDNFNTALYRVHYSNMSKFCNDIKTAERTREFYANQGIDTYIEPKEKKFVIYRQGDGKVLKSVDYYPVYLGDLV